MLQLSNGGRSGRQECRLVVANIIQQATVCNGRNAPVWLARLADQTGLGAPKRAPRPDHSKYHHLSGFPPSLGGAFTSAGDFADDSSPRSAAGARTVQLKFVSVLVVRAAHLMSGFAVGGLVFVGLTDLKFTFPRLV